MALVDVTIRVTGIHIDGKNAGFLEIRETAPGVGYVVFRPLHGRKYQVLLSTCAEMVAYRAVKEERASASR
jgi:hypothetical protein